jgi:hypothetical protein
MSGLTIQTGPWKNAKTQINREKIWSGGGVPSGGRAHAGNGNWRVVMDPSQMSSFSYDKGFPKPSKYSNPQSVVTKKAKIPFQKIPKAPINYLKEIATTLEEQNILIKKQIGIETPIPPNVEIPNIKHSDLLNERPGNRRFGTNTENEEVQTKQQSYGGRFVATEKQTSESIQEELLNDDTLSNFGDVEGNPNELHINTDLEEFHSKQTQTVLPDLGFSPVSGVLPQVSFTDIFLNGNVYEERPTVDDLSSISPPISLGENFENIDASEILENTYRRLSGSVSKRTSLYDELVKELEKKQNERRAKKSLRDKIIEEMEEKRRK